MSESIEEELRINRDRLDLAIKASELGTFYCDIPSTRLSGMTNVRRTFGYLQRLKLILIYFIQSFIPMTGNEHGSYKGMYLWTRSI